MTIRLLRSINTTVAPIPPIKGGASFFAEILVFQFPLFPLVWTAPKLTVSIVKSAQIGPRPWEEFNYVSSTRDSDPKKSCRTPPHPPSPKGRFLKEKKCSLTFAGKPYIYINRLCRNVKLHLVPKHRETHKAEQHSESEWRNKAFEHKTRHTKGTHKVAGLRSVARR